MKARVDHTWELAMFGIIKRMLESLSRNSGGRLEPECRFRAEATDSEVVCQHPDGTVERVAIADLKAVIIVAPFNGNSFDL
jgi:hypothetical protein